MRYIRFSSHYFKIFYFIYAKSDIYIFDYNDLKIKSESEFVYFKFKLAKLHHQ